MDLPKRVTMIEMVGPAGAGKTTLSRVLSQNDPNIQIGSEIELRKPNYLIFFIRKLITLIPFLLRQIANGRWFTWDEIKLLVYLEGWSGILTSEARSPGSTVLLDHGPVFKMATLREFGPEKLKHGAFSAWWDGMLKHWASTLDLIVWLDAPDAVLDNRINSRDQKHLVKGKNTAEVEHFLARYRSAYQDVLTRLGLAGGPQMLKFDTSEVGIEQVAAEIQRALAVSVER